MESTSTPSTSHPSKSNESVAPPKKRKIGHFDVHEKIIIVNVYKYVKETWPTDKYPSKNEMKDKVADMLGISKASVYRVLKEYILNDTVKPAALPKPATFMEKIDDFSMSRIRKIVQSFYLKKNLPSTKKIFQAVNADKTLPRIGLTTLKKIIKLLNFKYIKIGRNSYLMDKDFIALWRIKYLKNIKTCRQQGRPIYYLHETCVKAEPSVGKLWKDSSVQPRNLAFSVELSMGTKDPTPKRTRLIILHIADEGGFIPESELIYESKETRNNDESMDAEKFENWFQEMLRKLEPDSVLVMDNASYDSRRCREKVPKGSWKKEDVQQWLSYKKIPYDEHELKIELLEKVKNVKIQCQSYLVDEMAKTFGVEVFTIPPYHCELNPIELVCAEVKGYAARKGTTLNMEDFMQFLQDMHSVAAEKWQHCMSQVKREETELINLDDRIDKVIINETDEISDSSLNSEVESDSS